MFVSPHEYNGEEYEGDIEAMMIEMVKDSDRWFSPELTNSLPYMALCTGGEAGELQNIVKKIQRGSLELNENTRFKLVMEATDVLIYLMHIFAILKYSPAFAYMVKREENNARFGNTSSGADERVRGLEVVSMDEGSD